MNDNTYFITINNIKYKFQLKNGILQFCPDWTQSSTSKKEEHDIVLPQVVIVTRKNGIPLFALEPNKNDKNQFQIVTAQQLYGKAIQWFEPFADNYHELIWMNQDTFLISSEAHEAYKHFTWKNIIDFSLVDRLSISYRSKGSGDWKQSSKGAAGYLLIMVNNKPYWADAIGQIPYAVDTMKSYILKYKGDYDKAIKKTIITGIEFGNGGVLSREADYSNSYDNYLVLRGCLWSTKKFSYNSIVRHGSSVKSYITEVNGDFENILDSSISKIERNKYAQWNYKAN